MEPNEIVWGALLSACRVYSNMEIGLFPADQLFQLGPERSCYPKFMQKQVDGRM